VYSLPVEPDSLSAQYEGIPENRIFNRWLLIGPISAKEDDQKLQENEFNSDPILDQDYSDVRNRLVIADSSYTWHYVQAENAIIEDGIINLSKSLGNCDFASAYAYATIKMPEELACILGVGSDDAVKIWINGELVHSYWTARGLNLNNDLVPIKLKKGNNDILVKTQNRGGSWGFVCHVIMPHQYSQQLNFNAQIGNTENVKRLLEFGVNINSYSNLGLSPLQTARFYGQDAMAKFLLEQGADSIIPMPTKEEMVDAYLNFITKEAYPGAAVLISKNGHILYKKAYGYANLENEVPLDTDMKFRIGSTTKQFTAAAILKLQEQGLLNINDKVSQYIPELPRGNEVTIHQLITHTSGIQRDWNDDLYTSVPAVFESDKIIEEIKNSKYNFNPGESWSYSNFGYVVLSLIVERASGLAFIDFLSKNFFQPLGMMNTGINKWNELSGCEIIKKEASGYYYKDGKIYRALTLGRGMGAGALYSTLEDLFAWNEALFNNKILSQASLGAALSPVQAKDGSPDKYGLQYGYGLFIHKINGIQLIEHGGAIDGYECSLNRYTDSNMNIIVLFNRFPFPPGINANIVAQEIARIYLWQESETVN
jgi:CubicO group peptidase (beta-lactamase class C family)